MKTTPTILIVEDEALIDLDVENTLLAARLFENVLLTSCSAALQWLTNRTPDVAVIGISLRDGDVLTSHWFSPSATFRWSCTPPSERSGTATGISASAMDLQTIGAISHLMNAVNDCLQREPASPVPLSSQQLAAHAA